MPCFVAHRENHGLNKFTAVTLGSLPLLAKHHSLFYDQIATDPSSHCQIGKDNGNSPRMTESGERCCSFRDVLESDNVTVAPNGLD